MLQKEEPTFSGFGAEKSFQFENFPKPNERAGRLLAGSQTPR
jgi:hypothetical protein